MNSTYIILGVVVLVIVVGYVTLPYAKTKGWISKKIASNIAGKVDTSIDIVRAIIKATELKNININAINSVLDIADLATEFAVMVIDIDDYDQRVKLSKEVVYKVFDKLGISPTEAQLDMIDIIVEHGIELFENKKTVASTPTL